MHGRIIPLDSFLRSIHWGHASDSILDTHAAKFYFCNWFLAVPIFASQETSKMIPMERLFLRKTVVLQETYLVLGLWLACHFCFVNTSWLPSSSWCGQSQQPNWACFQLNAHGGTPGNCSWSLWHSSANSAVSCASGSLWGISCHWWLVCSNDANLALVVPGEEVCNFPGSHQKLWKHAKPLFYNACNIYFLPSLYQIN